MDEKSVRAMPNEYDLARDVYKRQTGGNAARGKNCILGRKYDIHRLNHKIN